MSEQESTPARVEMISLDAEDSKLVTLARGARSRTGAAEGAAVRDETGRTYAACTVALPSLRLTALQAAVAAAVASGAASLEAAAVVTDAEQAPDAGLTAVAELGGVGTPVYLAALDGTVVSVVGAVISA